MKTKQKAIQEAYGEHFEKCNPDEKGWCYNFNLRNLYENYEFYTLVKGHKWRPKSLQGIENNNGWEEIYSDGRIPNIDVWLIDKNGNIVFSNADEYIPREHNFTHYQPIKKPKPPIY